jgi:O-antigen biosynthesis protein WbqP
VSIPEKVALDAEYLRRQGFWFDLRILAATVLPVVTGKDVTR